MICSRRPTATWCFASALALAVLVLAPTAAHAHQASFTYATLVASDDQREVEHEIRIAATDLFEALDLDSDRAATDVEIASGSARLEAYVRSRVELSAPEQDGCEVTSRGVDVVGDGQRYAQVRRVLRCPEPITVVALDYDLFFDLDPQHTGLVTVDGELVELSLPDDTRLVYTIGEAPPGSALGFVRSGVEHIVFGADHILFLVSLLLVAALRRTSSGFRERGLPHAARYTLVIVSAFTVAHSVTLVAAALGWIELPSRLVESVIAASIVYVAIENVLRPDPPRRYRVTFVFGLVHGLGFASMLRPLLPPEDVVVPLLAFNVGVELGQIAVVALLLPVLCVVARWLGADRYQRLVVPAGASVLVALGLAWLLERAFALELVPF